MAYEMSNIKIYMHSLHVRQKINPTSNILGV